MSQAGVGGVGGAGQHGPIPAQQQRNFRKGNFNSEYLLLVDYEDAL